MSEAILSRGRGEADSKKGALERRLRQNVLDVHTAERAFSSERTRAGWWIGGVGILVGIVGCFTAAVVAVSHQPQTRYAIIDNYTGRITQTVSAEDAPSAYGDKVVAFYLASYVELRERFAWQLDPEQYHRATAMSVPDEQKRYAEVRRSNPPTAKYGKDGWARVDKWVAFTKREVGRDKTFVYDVQFDLAELLLNAAQVKRSRKTARLIFQFRPELLQLDQDAVRNPAGLMVISYTSTVD
jgi:type IV secretory pathway component VirB8